MKEVQFSLMTLALAGVFSVSAMAETIRPEVAATKAAGLFAQSAKVGGAKYIAASPKLAYTYTLGGDTCFYVFNNPTGGYAIIGGDESAHEVLAVVNHGSFDICRVNEAERYLLEQYAQDICRAKQLGMPHSVVAAVGSQNVAALCPTTWGQEAPYNNSCPTLTGSTTKAATGCAATAAAQCLYAVYYANASVPTHLRVAASFNHELVDANEKKTGNVTQSWSTSKIIDWENMLTSYDDTETAAQKAAVAGLMQLMGILGEMQYGPESGAYHTTVRRGLVNNLGFQAKVADRDDSPYKGNNTAWETLVYNELVAGRPVLYVGDNKGNGGHAFVVDGYNATNNLFHVNWGWDGSGDGYYALSSASDKKSGNYGETSWLYPTPTEQETGSSKGYYRDDNGIVYNLIYDANNLPAQLPAADADEVSVSENRSSASARLMPAAADTTYFYPSDSTASMTVSFGANGVRNVGAAADFVWGIELEPYFPDSASIPEEYDSYLLSVDKSGQNVEHFDTAEVVSSYVIPLGEYAWGTDEDAIPFGIYTVRPVLFYDEDDDEDYVDDEDIMYVALPWGWKKPIVRMLSGNKPSAVSENESHPAAVKTLHNGRIVIVKKNTCYSISGQSLK